MRGSQGRWEQVSCIKGTAGHVPRQAWWKNLAWARVKVVTFRLGFHLNSFRGKFKQRYFEMRKFSSYKIIFPFLHPKLKVKRPMWDHSIN